MVFVVRITNRYEFANKNSFFVYSQSFAIRTIFFANLTAFGINKIKGGNLICLLKFSHRIVKKLF